MGENLRNEDILPAICRDCRGGKEGSIHSGCAFCMDAKFQEGILCDLNRSVQDPDAFQCGACRPGLKVVGEPEGIEPLRSPQSKSPSGEARFQEEIRAQREKFTLALGRQRLESQPDEVFADLRYHLAWNVIYRRQAFGDGAEYSVFFRDVFREYSGSRGTFVALLWLCADHIHVYAECDVDRSVEDLGLGIKRFSEDAFLARFPDMKDRVFPEGDVWDPAYFVGTVG